MNIVVHAGVQNAADWPSRVGRRVPGAKVAVWPDVETPEHTEVAVVWLRAKGMLEQLPGLRLIISCGAGVDDLINDPGFPRRVPLARVVDAGMKDQVSDYVALAILQHHRRWSHFLDQQRRRSWDPRDARHTKPRVGLMGVGEVGEAIRRKLASIGYTVNCWARTAKPREMQSVYVGDAQLEEFANKSDIVVCALPLTEATGGILNARLFNALPHGAYVINVGRGGHVAEADLLAALDSGRISGACLDVFSTEPLPQCSWVWCHPHVIVTPHVANRIDWTEQALRAADMIRAFAEGESLATLVDYARGY